MAEIQYITSVGVASVFLARAHPWSLMHWLWASVDTCLGIESYAVAVYVILWYLIYGISILQLVWYVGLSMVI